MAEREREEKKIIDPYEVLKIGELDDIAFKLDEQVMALTSLKSGYETLVENIRISLDDSAVKVEGVIANLTTGLSGTLQKAEIISTSLNRANILSEFQIALKIAPRIRIYEYGTVPANDQLELFEKKITDEWSTEYMFIITHVANTTGAGDETGGWYQNTKAVWERDYDVSFKGRFAKEEIEYQYSKIDSPVELVPWIPIFYNHKWTVQNTNDSAVGAEVLMYGFVFPTWLWLEVTDRFFAKGIKSEI